MQPKSLVSLFSLTALACLILLSVGEAPGQVIGRGTTGGSTGRTGLGPTAGPTATTGTTPGSGGTPDLRVTIGTGGTTTPQVDNRQTVVAAQPSGVATSGTPPGGSEANSSVDGGDSDATPTPTPDITPTATPSLATQTTEQNNPGSASKMNTNSTPGTTPTPTPVASAPDYGPWWRWLFGGVLVVLTILGISYRHRNGRD
jgi:hypothetical protein